MVKKSNPFKLLIIVPTLNSKNYLPRLINSLRNQVFKNWRLIFIDGLSDSSNINFLIDECNKEKKFEWETQKKIDDGIFGAMNQGFKKAKNNEWVVFWGSDDWLSNNYALEKVMKKINNSQVCPDLLITKATYYNFHTLEKGRESMLYFAPFKKLEFLRKYNLRLFFGSQPPHQSAFIGPKLRKYLNYYDIKYKLAADLDYFLKIRHFKNLNIVYFPINTLSIGENGISGRSNSLRTYEVYKAYRNEYGFFYFIPFTLRYILRFIQILLSKL